MKKREPKAPNQTLLWALLFLTVLAVYWPALQGGQVWDDSSHVTRPDLQSFDGLRRIWFDLGATQQYYPLLHTAFWIEHRLWGDAVLGYHLTNVFLHLLSACLVVWIVRKLRLPGAWLAGFLFALHPICVEAVAWISEQKSALSGVFYLAAALLYLEFDLSRRRRTYFLAFALFVLALLSKSVTATLPAALLVVLWWRRGALHWKRDVAPLLPWFALGVPMGLFTSWVERTYIGAAGSEFALTWAQRLLVAGRVIWFYAAKLVWPVHLVFSYPRWTIDPGVWWQWLFPSGVLAVAVGLAVLARSRRGPLAGFLVFAGTLFPVLGFLNVLPFRYAWAADHFQYLAGLGIIVPAAAWLSDAARRRWAAKQAGAGAAAALALLAILSWRQSGIYRDEETLYRATLAGNPASWLAHNNLGAILESRPDGLYEAIAEFRAALVLQPGYVHAHFNLANALSRMEDPERQKEAIAEYQAAIRLDPDYAKARSNLGNILAHIPGRESEAITQYQAALRIDPNLAEAHAGLGILLAQNPERLPDAVEELETAVRLEPAVAEMRCNLGMALMQMPRKLPDAIAMFQSALQINPDLVEAHFLLGAALAQMPERAQDAAAEYQTALQLRPDFEPAKQGLAALGR